MQIKPLPLGTRVFHKSWWYKDTYHYSKIASIKEFDLELGEYFYKLADGTYHHGSSLTIGRKPKN